MAAFIITLYPFICILVPCMLYTAVRAKKAGCHLSKSHLIWVIIFLIYLSLVLNTTGIGTVWDIGKYGGIIHDAYNINLIPFINGISISLILNVFMFMPMGFLLPFIWKEFRKAGKVIVTGFLCSFLIEFCQLFNNRVTDIDDLIMNTLGTLAGFIFWTCFAKLFSPRPSKRESSLTALEPVLLILLGIAGQFFLYNWRWMVQIWYTV